jgi:hypothetical protein
VPAFFKQSGLQSSYLEGSVFDQLENRPDDQAAIRGISAVHLISIAVKQGIPLYHVSSDNAAAVLPLLALDPAVKSDISRAVGQGQNVLVPERNIVLGPWRGVGYIVRDDATGAGGYLISGGLAGGGLIECLLRKLVPIFVFILVILLIILLAYLLALLLVALWELIPVLVLALAAARPAAVEATSVTPTAREDVVQLLLISRALAVLAVGSGAPSTP